MCNPLGMDHIVPNLYIHAVPHVQSTGDGSYSTQFIYSHRAPCAIHWGWVGVKLLPAAMDDGMAPTFQGRAAEWGSGYPAVPKNLFIPIHQQALTRMAPDAAAAALPLSTTAPSP